MKKYILFDHDGVLVDTEHWYFTASKRALAELGIEIVSTGGTCRTLRDAGLEVIEVSEKTGFPEIMDGRVKTLQPGIHGGILARRDLADHRAAMAEHGIAPIDLLAVNLYPFEATVAVRSATLLDSGGSAKISKKYEDWIVDARRMEMADEDAIYMHPLPADRNIEVADAVIDGRWSRVFDQAENRLHAQKAVMALTM